MQLHAAPRLSGGGVILRAWQLADFTPFCDMLRDPTTESTIGIPERLTDSAEAWRSFLVVIGHWQVNGFGEWVVCKEEGEEFVGYAGFWLPLGASCVEISWCIHPNFRRRGYARAAAMAAMRCWKNDALDSLRGVPVIANIADGNHASERVAQSLGMSRGEVMGNPFRLHYAWRFGGDGDLDSHDFK